MLSGYLFVAVLILVIYGVTHENSRYAATASAIRQVWTANCRMGCRPGAHDGESRNPSRIILSEQNTTGRDNCLCEACPCELIENVLKSCRPSTRMCNQSIGKVSQYCNDIAKKFGDAYSSASSRVLNSQNQPTNQRHVQLISTRSSFDSADSFVLLDSKAKAEADAAKREKYLSSNSMSVHSLASGVPSASKAALHSVSGAAVHYGTELASKISLMADHMTSLEPAALMAPTKKKLSPSIIDTSAAAKKQSSSSMTPTTTRSFVKSELPPVPPKKKDDKNTKLQTSAKSSSSQIKAKDSVADVKKQCSRCVNQGLSCIKGCPTADQKQKKK